MEGAGGKELRPCWVTTVPRASIFRLAGLGDLSEQTPRGLLTSSSREDESPRETSCRALLEPRPREVRGWGRPVAHLGHPGLQTSNPPHFEGAGGGPSRGSRRWRHSVRCQESKKGGLDFTPCLLLQAATGPPSSWHSELPLG